MSSGVDTAPPPRPAVSAIASVCDQAGLLSGGAVQVLWTSRCFALTQDLAAPVQVMISWVLAIGGEESEHQLILHGTTAAGPVVLENIPASSIVGFASAPVSSIGICYAVSHARYVILSRMESARHSHLVRLLEESASSACRIPFTEGSGATTISSIATFRTALLKVAQRDRLVSVYPEAVAIANIGAAAVLEMALSPLSRRAVLYGTNCRLLMQHDVSSASSGARYKDRVVLHTPGQCAILKKKKGELQPYLILAWNSMIRIACGRGSDPNTAVVQMETAPLEVQHLFLQFDSTNARRAWVKEALKCCATLRHRIFYEEGPNDALSMIGRESVLMVHRPNSGSGSHVGVVGAEGAVPNSYRGNSAATKTTLFGLGRLLRNHTALVLYALCECIPRGLFSTERTADDIIEFFATTATPEDNVEQFHQQELPSDSFVAGMLQSDSNLKFGGSDAAFAADSNAASNVAFSPAAGSLPVTPTSPKSPVDATATTQPSSSRKGHFHGISSGEHARLLAAAVVAEVHTTASSSDRGQLTQLESPFSLPPTLSANIVWELLREEVMDACGEALKAMASDLSLLSGRKVTLTGDNFILDSFVTKLAARGVPHTLASALEICVTVKCSVSALSRFVIGYGIREHLATVLQLEKLASPNVLAGPNTTSESRLAVATASSWDPLVSAWEDAAGKAVSRGTVASVTLEAATSTLSDALRRALGGPDQLNLGVEIPGRTAPVVLRAMADETGMSSSNAATAAPCVVHASRPLRRIFLLVHQLGVSLIINLVEGQRTMERAAVLSRHLARAPQHLGHTARSTQTIRTAAEDEALQQQLSALRSQRAFESEEIIRSQAEVPVLRDAMSGLQERLEIVQNDAKDNSAKAAAEAERLLRTEMELEAAKTRIAALERERDALRHDLVGARTAAPVLHGVQEQLVEDAKRIVVEEEINRRERIAFDAYKERCEMTMALTAKAASVVFTSTSRTLHSPVPSGDRVDPCKGINVDQLEGEASML